MEYVFLTMALLLYIPMIVADKEGSAGTCEKDLLFRYSFFRAVSGTIVGAIFLFVWGTVEVPDLFTVLIAFLFAITLASGMVITFYSMQVTGIAIMSVFKAASVIIPCIIGALFFNEPINMINGCGFVLFVVSIFFVVSDKHAQKKKFGVRAALACLGVLLVSGLGSVALQLFGRCVKNGNLGVFMFLSYAIQAFMLFFICFFHKSGNSQQVKLPISKKMKVYGVIGALSAFLIQRITTSLSDTLPSFLIFPCTMGGSVVIGILIGRMFYREKLSFVNIMGIIGVIVSVLMINLF